MPLTFLPNTEILIALGRFALHFADLEHWVNMGIIEAESIADSQTQSALAWESFGKRAERLERSFQQVEAKGIIKFRPFLPVASDLISLARQRNDLLHGSPWTLLQIDRPDPDAKPGQPTAARTIHVSHNLATGARSTIETATLDALSRKAAEYAERITYLTGDLALANFRFSVPLSRRGRQHRTIADRAPGDACHPHANRGDTDRSPVPSFIVGRPYPAPDREPSGILSILRSATIGA